MAPGFLSTLAVAVLWAATASLYATAQTIFPYDAECAISAKRSRYAVPFLSSPAPGTFCFRLVVHRCKGLSPCCTTANLARFILDASATCDGANITATLNGRPLPNATVAPPPASSAGNADAPPGVDPAPAIDPATLPYRLLTIPGLALDAAALGKAGASLCLQLPTSGRCSRLVDLLAPGNATGAWAAALYSSDDLSTWGPDGDNSMYVSGLDLSVAAVQAGQPMVCIVRVPWWGIWIDTVDGLGFLWTALYDTSGKCCPTYPANRY
ncbi:hypothetical protein TSOC_001818 [Tetrabaena socialis]|uniref:Pherophorin domain-containing protein n=1 Tax=Tetrabaena socialis TaxID=47790 RepID=A0A2J8AFW9_9CHLO|nr:hypothetical protein TSOC_001818 [Tetrabaena socialis]|eukprot:PNH11415.1 hypothetical protein TSOC_001818 [Tetrabaena socialis]